MTPVEALRTPERGVIVRPANVGLEVVAMSCIVFRVEAVKERLVLFTDAEVSAFDPFEQVRVLAVRPERVVVTNVGLEVVAMSCIVLREPPVKVKLVELVDAEVSAFDPSAYMSVDAVKPDRVAVTNVGDEDGWIP